MSDLWLLLPPAMLGALSLLAIRWKCYALSIAITATALGLLVVLT